MWDLRDLSFGGREERYKKHHWAEIRCVDPVFKVARRFPSSLHFDNWQLTYARPGFVKVDTEPAPLEIIDAGRYRQLGFDLALHMSDSAREIQLVVRKWTPAMRERADGLTNAAKAHGISFVVREKSDIWSNLVLLSNLGRLRQLLTTHYDGLTTDRLRAIEAYLAMTPHATHGEIAATGLAPTADAQSLDAALFLLYVRGRVHLNIDEVPYEETTQITWLAGSRS